MHQQNIKKAAICAALGYDITNGLDTSQHLSNAVASVNVLIDVLTKPKTD